eukprot:5753261-Amphidinium_carterae.1
MNPITFHLRPVNDIPVGGHLLIEAPTGFVVPTDCAVEVEIGNPEEVPNITSLEQVTERLEVQRWSENLDTELMCRGDTSPAGGSNRGRLVLEGDTEDSNAKYLKGGILYVFHITVVNPQTNSDEAEDWFFRSYDGRRRQTGAIVRAEDEIIDSASVEGFSVSPLVEAFDFLEPSSLSAGDTQQLTFNISFPLDLTIGDTVDLVAPVSVLFGRRGSSLCYDYIFLQGSLQRTIPTCQANLMRWVLEEEVVPADTAIVFLVEVTNPMETPEVGVNYFQVRQIMPDGTQASSAKIPGYSIIPRLQEVAVELVYEAGISVPCR